MGKGPRFLTFKKQLRKSHHFVYIIIISWMVLCLLSSSVIKDAQIIGGIPENDTTSTSPSTRQRTSTRSSLEYWDIISYDDVLVVRNLNSPMSMQIADYFQQRRNIPDINIVNITTITSETISRTGFEDEIRTPVEDHIMNNGLINTINYIVTTKGVPLRVAEADTSDDNWNQPWTIDRASVDAELALILGPFNNNIGDPWWINNPYFDPNPYEEFDFTKYGYFLVTRFTGYDWNDIKNLIDKPELAIGRQGTFILDVDPGRDGGSYQIGNDWLRNANATLTANGFSTYLDETNTFLTNQINVSGYGSWGSNDGNYPKNSLLNTGFETDGNVDNIPDFWYYVNNTGIGICERNDTEVRTGGWSLRITRNATDENSTYARQNYTVKPNTRYYATGYTNLTGVSSDMGAHLQIISYDQIGKIVAFYNGSTRTGTTSNWVSLGQVHFEPIEGITNITMNVVLSKSQGTAFFDDISLYEIKPHNVWIPGSLAETFVSTGGRSFNYPTAYGQSLVADIIRDGVTGVKGYVYEPYLSAIAHPDILFDAYTQGFSAGDSYYMASEYLGWMGTMVCDPKLSPYNRDIIPDLEIVPGDIIFSDDMPFVGQIVDITATIKNLGLAAAFNVEVEFYVGEPETGIFLERKVLDISGSSSNITSIIWNTTGFIDIHNITVVIDRQNHYFEVSESNNIANKTITVIGYPNADAGLDGIVDEDSPFTFNGSASTDDAEIINYTWDFGDGNFGYQVSPTHSYTSSGTYTVILNVTNKFNLWDLDTVEIIVNNVAPFADAGSDLNGSEGIPIKFNASSSFDTPSDNSSLNFTWNFGDGNIGYGKFPNHTYIDNGSFLVSLVVRDNDGALDSDIAIVTIINLNPSISPVPHQYILEDSIFMLQINATDVSQDILNYIDNSTLFDINSTTGEIRFTPTNEDVGEHLVNITVTDEDGGVAYIEFQVTIQNTNDPPRIVSEPITNALEDFLYQYNVLSEDDDLDVLLYSIDMAPTGMTIDEITGEILWTPTNDDIGENYVIIRASDSYGGFDLQEFTIIVTNSNDAPILEKIDNIYTNEDQLFEYQVMASDIDPNDELSYYDDSDLFQINEKNGLISFIPINNDVGSYTITITVKDNMEALDSETFRLTILNINDPPILDPIGNLQATEDELFTITITAEDADVDDSLTFKDNSSLFEINPKTGIIFFLPSRSQSGVYAVNISVTDESNAMDYENILFTIINSNNPPLIKKTKLPDPTEEIKIKIGKLYILDISADDEDQDDSLTFSDDTDLFNIDPQTGHISFTPSSNDAGIHNVKITVTDSEGEEDEILLTFEITGDEKEEGSNLIWIILIFTISMIIVLILVLILRKKKGEPETEMIVLDKEQRAPVQIQGPGNFPPPPPPPPLPRNPF